MREFSPSNQILLNLFETCFMIIFELTLKQKRVKRCKQFKYYPTMRLKH